MQLTSATCPLDCPDACGVLVETDEAERFVSLRGNPEHSYSRGALCGKTAIYGDVVTSADRLRVPLVRGAGGAFEETSWDRALDVIARRLDSVPAERILALAYAGCMGQVNRYFPMRLFHQLGAVSTDGGLCDNSATVGYETVLGHVVGPDIESMRESDLLVLWGIDVRRTMQHVQPMIQDLCRRGVPVVAIDIYRTDTVRSVEKWGGRGLIVKPGSDAALALGLARIAFEEGFADTGFLENECIGGDAFRAHVTNGHGVDDVARATGLEASAVRDLARLLAGAANPFLKVGVGFARRRNGAMSMRAVCSLAAVLGRVDRFHYESFDHFGLDTECIPRPDLRPAGAPEPIRHVQVGRELAAGRFDCVFVWGHNPVVTVPDASRVRAGLARDDVFLVVHEQFLTETAQLADVVLPATTFVEQSDIFRSYGHRLMQYAHRAARAPAEQRSNVDTFRALARALGLSGELWERSEDELCRELLEASRARFEPGELERLLAGEPVKLEPRRFPDRGTPSGKIELASAAAEAQGQPALATYVPDDGCGGRGAFWLVPAPTKATHNSTFLHSPRHVKRAGNPRVQIHPADAERLGVGAGALVRLTNEQGELTFPVALSTDMPVGVVRVDGLPRGRDLPEGIGINSLTSPELTDLGAANVLYSTRVDVTPV